MVIKELSWDSSFFKKKMGELIITSQKAFSIKAVVDKARDDGFKYVICRIRTQQTSLIRLLESFSFYLSDVGLTWAIETDKFILKNGDKNSQPRPPIKVAIDKDIPVLQEISESLFIESRFYNDPFFSKEEADRLYRAWIDNSVKGNVADIVFFIPDIGFITCKKSSSSSGEIPLIGVKKELIGKGFGKSLIREAILWFKTHGIISVSVRTQMQNVRAMNFYARLGFHIKEYDLVFAKVL